MSLRATTTRVISPVCARIQRVDSHTAAKPASSAASRTHKARLFIRSPFLDLLPPRLASGPPGRRPPLSRRRRLWARSALRTQGASAGAHATQSDPQAQDVLIAPAEPIACSADSAQPQAMAGA